MRLTFGAGCQGVSDRPSWMANILTASDYGNPVVSQLTAMLSIVSGLSIVWVTCSPWGIGGAWKAVWVAAILAVACVMREGEYVSGREN